jgi:hypothetical protein
MDQQQRALALKILRCPVIQVAAKSPSHPCHQIVSSQTSEFQLPEPWNGDINAPILYLSSNPSYNPLEMTVTKHWREEEALDYFEKRLQNEVAVVDKKRSRPGFWGFIRNHATDLLGRNATCGTDYASTEVVHCKSPRQIGVPQAIYECSPRFLENVLEVCGAKVVFLVGSKALQAMQRFGLQLEVGHVKIWRVGAKGFLFAATPHPGDHVPSKLANVFTEEKIEELRQYLRY